MIQYFIPNCHTLPAIISFPIIMTDTKLHNGRRGRRFREAVDGPEIMRLYATMGTAELAERLGLSVKQIKNYVYRQNLGRWARKDASYLSRINSEKGKKGGRPRKIKS